MRHFLYSAAFAIGALFALPAFAASGHGGGMRGGGMMSGHVTGGMMNSHVTAASTANLSGRANVGMRGSSGAQVNMHTNHGATVSTAAHTAHSSGMKVGPQVRAVARTKA